jgi:hypothetical protein
MIGPDDLPDPGRAIAQHNRLAGPDGLAARQLRSYQRANFGLEAGAGLPVAVGSSPGGLPLGLMIRIPEEADTSTFISYVRNENVNLGWLPEMQPMFFVTYQLTRNKTRTFRSAANVARWILSPLGPDFADDEIVHAVLGVLKAAEYTGVRWYEDLERSSWYGNLMLEWYGPTHDAYRPAFLAQDADGQYLPVMRGD